MENTALATGVQMRLRGRGAAQRKSGKVRMEGVSSLWVGMGMPQNCHKPWRCQPLSSTHHCTPPTGATMNPHCILNNCSHLGLFHSSPSRPSQLHDAPPAPGQVHPLILLHQRWLQQSRDLPKVPPSQE
jgi:hypothetical protein